MSLTFYIDHDDSPEINMANGNAFYLMNAIGIKLDEEYYTGKLDAKDMLLNIMALPNVFPSLTERPEVREGNWIEGGYSAETIKLRLEQFIDLCRLAIDTNKPILYN
jgi:hypothetical protein